LQKSSFNHVKRDILFLIDVENLVARQRTRFEVAKSAVASLISSKHQEGSCVDNVKVNCGIGVVIQYVCFQ